MKARRLYRCAAVAAFVGASIPLAFSPPSNAATLCGHVRVNSVDYWPFPCEPPCTTVLIIDTGANPTNWVFLCIA
jgi:hypothetical protein